MMVLPTSVIKLLNLHNSASDARDFFLDTAKQIMDNRRKSDKKYNDFVQLLIDADISSADNSVVDENDVNESHHVNEGITYLILYTELKDYLKVE